MEFLQELFLTAALSLLFAILIGKIVSIASSSDDLDRDSAEKVALASDLGLEPEEIGGGGVGGGAVSIEEKRERSVEGEAETVGEICEEFVDEDCDIAEVLGSDRTEVDEEKEEGEEEIVRLGEEDRLVDILLKSEEATTSELDLEKVSEEEERFEENDVKLEEEPAKEMPEELDIERVDADSVKKEERLATDRDCLENVVRSSEEEIVHIEGSESEIGGGQKIDIDLEESTLLYEEDEWEGIERSEQEKLFGVATTYIISESGGSELTKLPSDVQMQLYGLHKVATEGPCYESQPLALKVSTRAKWHAWQRLGNMNPEVAMEQYMTLLSDSIPGWMGEKSGGDAKQDQGNDSPEARISGSAPDLSSYLQSQLNCETERKPEGRSSIGGEM